MKTVIGVLKVEASIIQTVFRPVGHLKVFQDETLEDYYDTDNIYLAGPCISVVVGDKTADGAKESCNDKEREEEAEENSATAIAPLVIWGGWLAATSTAAATAAAEEKT